MRFPLEIGARTGTFRSMRGLLVLLMACSNDVPVDISHPLGADLAGFMPDDGAATSSDLSASDLSSSSPGPCGGQLCRADQTCVSGKCQFSCSGVTVPGMFSTLASAATSLEGTGGVICVGAFTFTSSESVPYNRALTIIGLSPDQSIFQKRVDLVETTSRTSNTPANIIIKGISVQGGMSLEMSMNIHDHLLMTATRVRGLISATPNAAQIVLDGDDLANDAQNPALDLLGVFTSAPTPALIVQNCFIHDSGIGIHHLEPTATNPITIVDNTFLNDTSGLIGDGMVASLAANNLFANSLNAGVDIQGVAWNVHNNSFFMTGSNAPPPGASDVTADPRLDTQSPPALGAGSPLLGAGDATVAPATDFFARPRSGRSDIGARQDP
jgi:hypothetical protein